MYKIKFLPCSQKEYNKLKSSQLKGRIISSLQLLTKKPFKGKPLQAYLKGLYSLRVGDYRIVYKVLKDKRSIVILKIGHRKEVYR